MVVIKKQMKNDLILTDKEIDAVIGRMQELTRIGNKYLQDDS